MFDEQVSIPAEKFDLLQKFIMVNGTSLIPEISKTEIKHFWLVGGGGHAPGCPPPPLDMPLGVRVVVPPLSAIFFISHAVCVNIKLNHMSDTPPLGNLRSATVMLLNFKSNCNYISNFYRLQSEESNVFTYVCLSMEGGGGCWLPSMNHWRWLATEHAAPVT